MTQEIQQYYSTLVDKDADKVAYYYDITAVNKQTGINFTVCSVQQNQRKATGAERFKELAERAERQKYDILVVREYGADGTSLVNNLKLPLQKGGKKRNKGGNAIVPYNNSDNLSGFEQTLGKFGFTDGLMGVIDATAERRTNDYIMQQQRQKINELETELALCKQEQMNLKNETETYKERYKEILDEKREMERDHKHEVQDLQQKNQLGSLAIQGALGFLSKNPAVANVLGALTSPAPAGAQSAAYDDDDYDDDVVVVKKSADPEVQKHLNLVQKFTSALNPSQLYHFAVIISYAAQGNNLESLSNYCKEQHNIQKQNTENG